MGIQGPAIQVGPDLVPSRLLSLDQRVVVLLADGLGVGEVEEQYRVALVWRLVVHHGRARMMPVPLDDDAAAALAGVEVASQGLPADAMRAAPALV